MLQKGPQKHAHSRGRDLTGRSPRGSSSPVHGDDNDSQGGPRSATSSYRSSKSPRSGSSLCDCPPIVSPYPSNSSAIATASQILLDPRYQQTTLGEPGRSGDSLPQRRSEPFRTMSHSMESRSRRSNGSAGFYRVAAEKLVRWRRQRTTHSRGRVRRRAGDRSRTRKDEVCKGRGESRPFAGSG